MKHTAQTTTTRTLTPASLATIEAVQEANRTAGLYWFSTATLAFFRSRILPTIYGGCVFVSSEQHGTDNPRVYSVRIAIEGGDIETLGNFGCYETRGEAVAVAKTAAAAIQQGLPIYLRDGVMVQR